MKILSKEKITELSRNVNVTKSGVKISEGPENSDFKSGLAVISGVVKSGKINITKACKNLGLKKLGC